MMQTARWQLKRVFWKQVRSALSSAGPLMSPRSHSRQDLDDWMAEASRMLPALHLHMLYKGPEGLETLVLIGALHDSEDIAHQVDQAITSLKPCHVGLELCARRFRRLFPFGVGAFLSLAPDDRHQLLQRLPSGKEQLAAAAAAERCGVPITLCDRDSKTSERRFLAALGPETLAAGSMAAFGGACVPEVQEKLETAFATYIVGERDFVLAHKLVSLPGLVAGVVGRRHVPGIIAQLQCPFREEDAQRAENLCAAVHLPLWRSLLGRPLLWHLRGTATGSLLVHRVNFKPPSFGPDLYPFETMNLALALYWAEPLSVKMPRRGFRHGL
eukprot:s1512_g13.t1